jgi:hypothetical protein
MAGLLFVSQAMLDSWAGLGKIDFVGNVMTLVSGDGKGRSYALEPAVRFLKVLGDADPHGLVHKVKPVSALRELGAEAVGDSCILGDVAYEVEAGFFAEASALQAAATARPTPAATARPGPARAGAPAPPSKPAARPAAAAPPATQPAVGAPVRPFGSEALPKDLEEKRKEAEALARFLLENLT